MTLRRWQLLASLALALGASAPAAEAAGWLAQHPSLSPNTSLGARTPTGTPTIGLTSTSDNIAVLPVTDGTSTYFQVADRPAGGNWTAPAEVGGPAQGNHHASAVDSAGNTVVVWVQSGFRTDLAGTVCGSTSCPAWWLMARYRPAGGSWGTAGIVGNANVYKAQIEMTSPHVTFTGNGTAMVVWSQRTISTGDWSVRWSSRTAGADGGWSLSTALASATSRNDPDPYVAGDQAGDAVAAWTYQTTTPSYGARVAVRPRGGSWSAVEEIGSAGSSLTKEARAGVFDNGGSPYYAAAFVRGGHVKLGYDNNTSSWQENQVNSAALPGGGGGASGLQMMMRQSTGESVVAWREAGSGGASFVAAVQSYTYLNPTPNVLSQYGTSGGSFFAASTPALALDSTNTAVVAWTLIDNASSCAGSCALKLQSAKRIFGGWAGAIQAQSVTAPSSHWTTPAAGGGGLDIGALWVRGSAIDSSLFDGTAPTQSGLTVPSTVEAGSPVNMSVSGSDVWSGTTTTWTFGDGTSATGQSVSHSWSVPGLFAVRAVTTDSAGNQTLSAERSVSVGPSASSDGFSWLTPVRFFTDSPDAATITMNGRGDAAAVWATAPDTCSTAEAYVRPAGGVWAQQTFGAGCNPFVAIHEDGSAIAVWENQFCAQTDCVYAARRPAGGSWGSPMLVASSTGVNSNQPVVAFRPNGTATAAWWVFDSGTSTYSLQSADWAGSTWSTPIAVAGSGDTWQGTRPTLVFDGSGGAAIAWRTFNGSLRGIKASTRTSSGAWANASSNQGGGPVLGPVAAAGVPSLTVNSQGTFLVIWDAGGTISLATATAAGGAWTVAPGPAGTTNFDPAAVFDASDRLIAAWAMVSGGNRRTQTAVRTGSSWGAAQNLSSTSGTDQALAQAIATDGPGNVIVGWAETLTDPATGTPLYLIQFSRRASGAATSGATDTLASAADPMGGPFLGADAAGNVSAMWLRGNYVETTGFDPVAPAVGTVDIPATAVVGQPTTYTASATDVFGPITYVWEFDGGPPVTGQTVQHTFPHASPHTVVLRVRDGAGNVTTVSRTVEVSDPAATTSQPPASPPVVAPNNLPAPRLGETINVFVLKDPVTIKLPGRRRFQPLKGQANLPNGTVIDTRKGRVLVVIDNGAGGSDAAEFYEGVFEVNQPKRLKGLANIFLNGGGFKGCPKAPKDPHKQVSGAANRKRSVRHLWGKGKGKFRTVGRFSSATLRGTTWLTDDRCDGTLTKVRRGKVAVRDFVKRKTVIVKTRQKYFAAARAGRR